MWPIILILLETNKQTFIVKTRKDLSNENYNEFSSSQSTSCNNSLNVISHLKTSVVCLFCLFLAQTRRTTYNHRVDQNHSIYLYVERWAWATCIARAHTHTSLDIIFLSSSREFDNLHR